MVKEIIIVTTKLTMLWAIMSPTTPSLYVDNTIDIMYGYHIMVISIVNNFGKVELCMTEAPVPVVCSTRT